MKKVIKIKIVLLLAKNVFFSLNEGISEKMCYAAQKHTAIVNSLDPVRINLSKNSSSCTTKIIPNFCVFFKSSFTNQKHEVDNNRCSSTYILSNWYSRFLCLAKMPLSKHGHSTFIMIIP